MSVAFQHDHGAWSTARAGGAVRLDEDAGTQEIVGPWMRRIDFLSGKVVVVVDAPLAAGQTVTVDGLLIEDAVDDQGLAAATFAEVDDAAHTLNLTQAGADPMHAALERDVDFGPAREYVRPRATVTIGAGAGTVIASIAVVLGGAWKTPARSL
ncbi:MAG: hypothetical protein AAGN66_16260 [Acidobacteriota bacterium]